MNFCVRIEKNNKPYWLHQTLVSDTTPAVAFIWSTNPLDAKSYLGTNAPVVAEMLGNRKLGGKYSFVAVIDL